jgi:hypothetical protein
LDTPVENYLFSVNLDGRVTGIVFVFIQLCDHQGTKAEEEQQEEAGSFMSVSVRPHPSNFSISL